MRDMGLIEVCLGAVMPKVALEMRVNMHVIVAIGALALLSACQMTGTPPSATGPMPPAATPPSNLHISPPGTRPGRSGSADPRATVPPSNIRPDACGAAGLQHWIGRPAPASFPVSGPVRVYATGQPVTMDYNPQRLNVEVSRASRPVIVAISCG